MEPTIELSGFPAYIYALLFNVTVWAIILLGTWALWSWLILDVLLRTTMRYFKAWYYVLAYMRFHGQFHEWYDEFRAKTLAEAENDKQD